MKISRSNIIALITAGSLMAFSAPLTAAGTAGAQFLKLGAGARAAALGDSFSAIADDVTATYWNPAGLAQLKRTEVAIMQNAYLEDSSYQYVGAAKPFEKNTFGLALYRMDFGSIDSYDSSNNKLNNFDASSMAGGLSWAREVTENLYLGITAKYITESIQDEKAAAFAGDFGLLRSFKRFNLSLSAHHIGSSLKFVSESEELPQTFRAGVATKFMQDRVTLAVDASKPKDNDASIGGGLEVKLMPSFMLRGGYRVTPGNAINVDGLTNMTGGFGVNLSRINIDYAFIPFGDLGDTHRISLLVHFE